MRMLLGAINWFLRWYRAGGRLTVDEIAAAYVDFVLYGLLAPSTAAGSARGRVAAASVTTPAHKSVSTSARPTVVLDIDSQGKGKQRSITYTASVLDASGRPLTDAEVSLLAWMPDGSDLIAPLGSTDTPGTYRGTVEVGVFTPGNLRIRIGHGAKHVDIAPRRPQS